MVQGCPLPSVKTATSPVSMIVTVTETDGLVREGKKVGGSLVNDPMLSVQTVVIVGKQDDV